jgi:hypothetical protein
MAKIASFKDVISDKFYDVIFSALSAHIEENPARLGCRSSYVEEPEEARLEDMEVRLLSITGTTSTELKFDVAVSAEIEIAETVRRERESDSAEQWFRVSCSCDISNGIKNFRVEDFHIYSKSRAGKPGQLSDYLIPIIHKDELDTVAEDFLRQYYPEALEKPMPVSSAELAERMGLTIRQEHITKTCSVFGQVFFADCLVPCYDEEKGVYHEVAVEEGTILVDPDVFFMYTLGSYNNTIVHECVHWGLHRRFFELEKLYNEEAKSIVCQVKEGDAPEKKRSPLEWMEWQANHLSPRILMPISTTKIKINELFAEKKAQSPEAAPSEIMEQVVASLADFFGVSKQSAKIRMIDLGYTDAIGVFNYTEDGYVQSHSFKSKAVGKNQTFVATEADLAIAFLTKPEFKSMMESGRYVYVDKHVCINDKKYIGRTAAGTAVLTDYAMQHMDECCLAFEISYKKNNQYGASYYTECALFRAAMSDSQAEAGYVHNQFNQALDIKASTSSDFQATVKAVTAIKKTLPGEFGDTLSAHIKRLGLTNEALADRCLINEDNIRKYRSGAKTPKLQTVVALCVGLQLSPLLCFDLLDKCGFTLKNGMEQAAYHIILCTMTQNSIYECNEMLRSMNLRPLSKEE